MNFKEKSLEKVQVINYDLTISEENQEDIHDCVLLQSMTHSLHMDYNDGK